MFLILVVSQGNHSTSATSSLRATFSALIRLTDFLDKTHLQKSSGSKFHCSTILRYTARRHPTNARSPRSQDLGPRYANTSSIPDGALAKRNPAIHNHSISLYYEAATSNTTTTTAKLTRHQCMLEICRFHA